MLQKRGMFKGPWDIIQFIIIGIFLDEYFKRNGFTIESFDMLIRNILSISIMLEWLILIFKGPKRR